MSIIPSEKTVHGIVIRDPTRGKIKGFLLIVFGILLAPLIIGLRIFKVGAEVYRRSTAWYGPKFYRDPIPMEFDDTEVAHLESVNQDLLQELQSKDGTNRSDFERYLHTSFHLTRIKQESLTPANRLSQGILHVDNYLTYGMVSYAVQAFDLLLFPFTAKETSDGRTRINLYVSIRQAILLALMHYDHEAADILQQVKQVRQTYQLPLEKQALEISEIGFEDVEEPDQHTKADLLKHLDDLHVFAIQVLHIDPRKMDRASYVVDNYPKVLANNIITRSLHIEFEP